jgi:phosphatidylserine/phosphatidylglycerophosphate/cardiolipin synthase-like enzyme
VSRMALRTLIKRLLLALLVLWAGTAWWHTHKPLIDGAHISAVLPVAAEQVHFLYDLTWRDGSGQRHSEQQIFNAVFRQIDEARDFIVMDYFLLNDADGRGNAKPLRPLSRELADHLLQRKRARPQLQVLLLTDPINDVYFGSPSALLAELQQAGIDVVRTDLTLLRDSNPAYSAWWRIAVQWFGNSNEAGWLPNPFDDKAPKITLRSWLSLLNLKANHRKVMVTNRADGEWVAIVASANPHDASSAHSNVALQFSGALAQTVFGSEVSLAHASGWIGDMRPVARVETTTDTARPYELAYLTEGAIHDRLLRELQQADSSTAIRLAIFYLSDRDVITALQQAAQRGASVQLLLDPNKDAFGIEKDGVPNRPVANELLHMANTVSVRWYNTHGEQFHTKLLLIQRGEQLFATLGSANFTRRNLRDYNLEANAALTMPVNSELAMQLHAYFNRIWQSDSQDNGYTLPASAYVDNSTWRYWRYRVMEASGLSSF